MIYTSSILDNLQWSAHIDVLGDLKEITYKMLLNAGYKDADPNASLEQFFNLQKRKIERKPRKVFCSKEFSYPTEYERAYLEFIERVEKGEDLTPFQSTKILDPTYYDLLLNDWNIHHFHLTRRFQKNGFSARSHYLLFAFVTEKAIYLIQTYTHQYADDNRYAMQEMVRIIHRNWPELIARYRIKGAATVTEHFTDLQYAEARESHGLLFIEPEKGSVYCLIGGGYSTSGMSLDVLKATDSWIERSRAAEQYIVQNIPSLISTFVQMATCELYEFSFHLLWADSDEEFTFLERNSLAILQVNLEENYLRICHPANFFGSSLDNTLGGRKILPK